MSEREKEITVVAESLCNLGHIGLAIQLLIEEEYNIEKIEEIIGGEVTVKRVND